MEIAPGAIVEGSVKSITSFGAFVALDNGTNGLVHISEVAPTYVKDIHEHLTEGQKVKVKVLRVDERGRLSLSIKQALPARESGARPARESAGRPSQRQAAPARPSRPVQIEATVKPQSDSFEDKLKQFMADSNSKISGVRQYEHRTRSRKR